MNATSPLKTWSTVLVATALLGACGGGSEPAALQESAKSDAATALSMHGRGRSGILSIDVLSNRADLISGGNALVAVRLDASVDPSMVKMRLNGGDVGSMFALRENGQYMGLLTGLVEGRNELTALLPSGTGQRIVITNHPIGGPVFAGPQVQPWLCRTHLQTDPAMEPAIDEQCNAPTVVDYFYRTLSGAFVVYNPTSPPEISLIRQVTTDQGKTVPFIVQRVTGTADRGIYQFAVVVDPGKPVSPWSTEQPWNHKVYNIYGGGCSVPYQQSPGLSVLANGAAQLARGFVVSTSSLNRNSSNCNDVVSSEALMMTKEIVTERYGEIRYTIGNGGSGGAMQQHGTVESYPGLLNGLLTSLSFPDTWHQMVGSFDCYVLWRYFGLGNAALGLPVTVNPLWPTSTDRLQVWGSDASNPDNLCGQKLNAGNLLVELVATSEQGSPGPSNDPPWRYDPVTNPRGARATIQDYQKAIFGVDADGKALRPIDNVGVQYGLSALLDGTITAEQFVDLNEKVGGLDLDGNPQVERTAADPLALRRLYRSGRNVSGRGAPLVAEIDTRANPTDTGTHEPLMSFSYRARLDRTNGSHDGQVIWIAHGGTAPDSFGAMDAWLSAVESDTSAASLPAKVIRNKPTSVFDACYQSNGVVSDLTCGGTWKYNGTPRTVAGMPIALDIYKCRLKPLKLPDYPVAFTHEQWARLEATFPSGVCDWSKPSVGQQPSIPWLTFAAGPGGRPLGDPPVSSPVGHGSHDR